MTVFWSEWGDSNARSLEPKSSAIPPSLHPDIKFFSIKINVRDFSGCGKTSGQK